MIFHILEQTNRYVHQILERPRPTNRHSHYPWQPVWVETWEPFNKQKLWHFLTIMMMVLWISQHKTSNKEELWSTHWFWRRYCTSKIMASKDFKVLKAALHFQSDDENQDRGQGEQPYICKIGMLFEILEQNCLEVYYPGCDLAIDEATAPVSTGH